MESWRKNRKKRETRNKINERRKIGKRTKEIPALFEEADGIWFNLQGEDRKKQIEKYKKRCEKQNKKFKLPHSVKTELKLHITYEGWKKDSDRSELVNKHIIAGMMTPKTLKKLRDVRVYQTYNEKSIQLRANNGDGANWILKIATEDTICQKDSFHIQQEIVRDIKDKEKGNIQLEKVESEILIDNSIEEWIKENFIRINNKQEKAILGYWGKYIDDNIFTEQDVWEQTRKVMLENQ